MSKLVVTNIETQNIKFDSDTTAFTIGSDGVLSGTGSPSMVKLYDQSATDVANVTIDSTIINSTYDNYYIIFDQLGATDQQYLTCRLAVGGVIQSGSTYYGYETQRVGGSYASAGANYNTSSYFTFFSPSHLGNAAGEVVSERGSINAETKAIANHLLSFRKVIKEWFTRGEQDFSRIRDLPFKYPDSV